MQDGAAEIVPRHPTGQEPPAPRPLDGMKYAVVGYPRNAVCAALHHCHTVHNFEAVTRLTLAR